MNNPMQFINMLKASKSPKDAVINMIKSNNNPMVKNLVEMAENGNSKGVEDFARNLYAQQGRDFDKEFNDFMKNFK
jgi:hypothetical protein